jgi:hypothetical protein
MNASLAQSMVILHVISTAEFRSTFMAYKASLVIILSFYIHKSTFLVTLNQNHALPLIFFAHWAQVLANCSSKQSPQSGFLLSSSTKPPDNKLLRHFVQAKHSLCQVLSNALTADPLNAFPQPPHLGSKIISIVLKIEPYLLMR